jgi:hypothetical protein
MAPTWQITEEDTLRIQYKAGGGLVILLGVTLLFLGVKPVTWFVLALINYVPTNIIGLALLFLTAAVFVVPGLLLAFGGKRLEIDSTDGEVREIQDYVVWRTTSHYDFSEMACVRARVENSGRHSAKHRVDLVVKGAGDGTRKILAARLDTKDIAQVLGNIVAEKLGVPFENLTEAPSPASRGTTASLWS